MFYDLPKTHTREMIRNESNKTYSEYLELLDLKDLRFRPIVAGPA